MQENIINKSYKTQIYLNNKQKTLLGQAFGASRFVFNWALKTSVAHKEQTGKYLKYIDLQNELVKLKQLDGYGWLNNCKAEMLQSAIKDFDNGLIRFFANCKNPQIIKKGFPKFKSRKDDKQSCRFNQNIIITHSHINIFRKLGNIKLSQKSYIPLSSNKEIKICFATLIREAGKYYAHVCVQETVKIENSAECKSDGFDFGIKDLAISSNGTKYPNIKPYISKERSIKRLQRKLSKKKKGSNNYNKALLKLQRAHFKVKNIRADHLHKVSSKIVNENQVIYLETLSIKNMIKCHNLAKALSDASLGMLKNMIVNKAKWQGKTVIFIDRWFPSSKKCYACGNVKKVLKLSERTYRCEICGYVEDRDINAAKNIKKEGQRILAEQSSAPNKSLGTVEITGTRVSKKRQKSVEKIATGAPLGAPRSVSSLNQKLCGNLVEIS